MGGEDTRTATMAQVQQQQPGEWGPVEVFRAGDYGVKGKYSETDLDEVIGAFKPEHFAPPMTLHHEDKQGPHAQVSRLERVGKKLHAWFKDVSSEAKSWLGERPYVRPSVEFYNRSARTGGKLALRAVSFVSVPEVKGMALIPPLAFGEDEGEFFRIDFSELCEEQTTMAEEQPQNKPAQDPKVVEKTAEVDPAAVTRMSETVAAQAKQIADLSRDLRRAEWQRRVQELASKGVPPAVLNRPGLAEFSEAVAGLSGTVKFGEGDKAGELTPAKFLDGLLEGLAGVVPMGERPTVESVEHKGNQSAEDKLTDAAEKLAKEKGLRFDEALEQVIKLAK